MKINPVDCGCWYCQTDDPLYGWLFSFEFDCDLHRMYLERQINLMDEEDPELLIFMAEFEYYLDEHVCIPYDENWKYCKVCRCKMDVEDYFPHQHIIPNNNENQIGTTIINCDKECKVI